MSVTIASCRSLGPKLYRFDFNTVDPTGLPVDSREADERAAERTLREMRARVKAARAVVATTPGLAETIQCDWRKAARFYAQFGISEASFRFGVPQSITDSEGDALDELMGLPFFLRGEASRAGAATFPI